MGYSYTNGGELCCDECGTAPARKMPCPVNYCPATALCVTCREKPEIKKELRNYHAQHCRPARIKADQRAAERLQKLRSGAFLRCAALQHNFNDGAMVKVCFQNLGRQEKSYFMSPATYHAFPLLEDVTPQDYADHGAVIPAKNNSLHSPE